VSWLDTISGLICQNQKFDYENGAQFQKRSSIVLRLQVAATLYYRFCIRNWLQVFAFCACVHVCVCVCTDLASHRESKARRWSCRDLETLGFMLRSSSSSAVVCFPGTRTYICMYVCFPGTRTYICMHTCPNTLLSELCEVYTHKRIHAQHTYTHTYAHTHPHSHKHTHTHTGCKITGVAEYNSAVYNSQGLDVPSPPSPPHHFSAFYWFNITDIITTPPFATSLYVEHVNSSMLIRLTFASTHTYAHTYTHNHTAGRESQEVPTGEWHVRVYVKRECICACVCEYVWVCVVTRVCATVQLCCAYIYLYAYVSPCVFACSPAHAHTCKNLQDSAHLQITCVHIHSLWLV